MLLYIDYSFIGKDIEEEGTFIGQNDASQEKPNLATFTLFSQKNDFSVSSGKLMNYYNRIEIWNQFIIDGIN